MKLAPELQRFHLETVGRHRSEAAARELRALLAVARAAGRIRPYLPGWEDRTAGIVEALYRLQKASEP